MKLPTCTSTGAQLATLPSMGVKAIRKGLMLRKTSAAIDFDARSTTTTYDATIAMDKQRKKLLHMSRKLVGAPNERETVMLEKIRKLEAELEDEKQLVRGLRGAPILCRCVILDMFCVCCV